MKVVLIDEDVEKVCRFLSIEGLVEHMLAKTPEKGWREEFLSDSRKYGVLYCWICPFADDVYGERIIRYSNDLSQAQEDQYQAAQDI